MKRSGFDKVWNQHVIASLPNGEDILFIDRHLLHEVSSPQAFDGLRNKKRQVKFSNLTVGTEDHIVSTEVGIVGGTFPAANTMLKEMRQNTKDFGVFHNRVGSPRAGIVHVIAPEQGIVTPGMTVVCGDSHTCTLGALGAVAIGIGTSEVEHVLATQTLVRKRPEVIRVYIAGALSKNKFASPKDIALHLCSLIGSDGAIGSTLEYYGPGIQNMLMEGRLTLCNMAAETGAISAFIAPDSVTIEYCLQTENFSNQEDDKSLTKRWVELAGSENIRQEADFMLDVSTLAPQITWGTTPSQTIDITGVVPQPKIQKDVDSLKYMGLQPGQKLIGLPIDAIFIGSCTNSRISDLRAAARVCERMKEKVAPNLKAYVVPGSGKVFAQAAREGLLSIFSNAGFEVRTPGCSMCVSINREFVPPDKRCLSTSNRNFEHRQGPNARTHLCSPVVAAASAIAGYIYDTSNIAEGETE